MPTTTDDDLTDDEIDAHLDQNPSENTPLVQRLRALNRKLGKQANEVPGLKAKLAEKDFGDVLKTASLDGLNARQQATLRREVGDDISEDSLWDAATELFGLTRPDEQPVVSEDEQAAIDRQAAVGQGGEPPSQTGVLKPDEVSQWPVDKLIKFHEAHPDAYEALKRGEVVTGLTGW